MVFTTLIPTRLNDGTPVRQAELDEIVRGLWERFGGATIDGVVTGHWVDPGDGRHYQDESLKVTVACEPERIAEAMETVIAVGRRLEQEAMYFEVRDFGVAFLKTAN